MQDPSPAAALPALEVGWRDISAYRAGTGDIPYVFTFAAAAPGPHVVVNALTHGNEVSGREVVLALLDAGVRPLRGTLSLALANVVAHDRFDPANPGASRFVDRDFNRLWDDALIEADDQSVEALRARELRPLYRQADRLLDLHTTFLSDRPFFVVPDLPKAIGLARDIGTPATTVVLSSGGMHGPTLMEYAPFADPDGAASAVVAECGQHWARAAVDQAMAAAVSFLALSGTIDGKTAAALSPPLPAEPPRLYRMSANLFATTDSFRYVRSFRGFDPVGEDEIVAWDGDQPIHAPHADAVVILARPHPKRGGEAMSFGRLVGGDEEHAG
ncbi:MAG: succinylglutamate desuccinylase/aspartoacylase family protein [Rhodospirillaceae bacterium]|nr:succinylglutamate desuccinylase/aspartoacylase family protein [Rhodospirillaceae bacterium]